MEQPHQHGPNCKHGPQGHGHGGHGHGGHAPHGANNIDPDTYFQRLSIMKKQFIQNYWMQILSGKVLNKYLQKNGIKFCQAIDSQFIMMIVVRAQMMLTFQWLPLFLRPFISGLFFPLIFLIFFNFNVIYGIQQEDYTIVHIFGYLTIVFYTLTALRQGGSLSTQINMKKTQQAINQRPYLQNLKCPPCRILRIFRSTHCPICQTCIPKFTRHSLAFGVCIGACNQILAFLYFLLLTVTQLLTVLTFFNSTQYGIITDIMFYALNIYIFYTSFIETMTLLILNFGYGITENQIKNWTNCQYLIKMPQKQFTNCVDKGFIKNIIESLYSLFNISVYESEKKKQRNPMQQQIPISGKSLQFQALDKNKTYYINWAKAFFYLTPQFPSYCSRDVVIEIMARQQPKMIQMFKLQKKFRQEVLKQNQGQQIPQFQIQQKVMMKMQLHMMKNGPPSMMMRPGVPQHGIPNPQQQKMMQIQMLTHMQNQLSTQPEFASRIKQILQKLKQDTITPMQVGLAVRQIQQDLMKKKMEAVMKQKAAQEQKTKEKSQATLNQQDQQQQLKKQEIPDQNL